MTPPQRRILRHLSASGTTGNGYQAKQLGDLADANRDDFAALARAGYIAGRENGSNDEPCPAAVLTATNPWTLRIYLTAAGERAAGKLSA